MKQTPFHACHVRAGGRLVDFAGWHMPVQYASILDEVRRVRTGCGLYDLSHMGRVRIEGKDRIAAADRIFTNHVAKLKVGDIRYSLICNEQGNAIDDVLIYGESDAVFVVVNASNTDRDLAHMRELVKGHDARIVDLTEELAMCALQGPLSEKLLARSVVEKEALASLGYYKLMRGTVLGMQDVRISRTGYTGEDGFELYFPRQEAERVWDALLASGGSDLMPCGLGSRDTLRLEAGMPLYGHELGEEINPLEAGLDWAVKFAADKPFVGRAALERIKAAGPQRKLVGLIAEGKRIPRQGYAVRHGGADVGFVCSGTYSPTLDKNLATAYVPAALADGETSFEIDLRGTAIAARQTPLPFYKRQS
ncbi:MAG: glycine cleavage system aminomethyltransferase GcvT [Planctomycetes bacterium]|nr:glycine cleavage system aminomethyltransferase GcvT [Planctomycetota bacterium]